MIDQSPEGDEILRQMAEIRGNLHQEVEGIAEGARTMTDWHYYLRRYPWASVGAAVALGYLIVPNRLHVMQPDEKTLLKLARKNRLLVTPEAEPEKQGGVVGALFTLVASTLVRGLVAYAGQQAGKVVGHYAGVAQDRAEAAEQANPPWE